MWADMFLSQKSIQGLFLEFHNGLQAKLKEEFKFNKDQLQLFLTKPAHTAVKPQLGIKTKYLDAMPKILRVKDAQFLNELKTKILADD